MSRALGHRPASEQPAHLGHPAHPARRLHLIRAARTIAGVVMLGVLLWRVGTGPFLRGVRAVDPVSLVAAVALTAVATICAAWRWRCVVRALGAEVTLPAAIAAYYRSQLINLTVPGGILGDVDRAAGHARRTGEVGVSARAVWWERAGGQVVQAAVTVAVLLAAPSPVRRYLPGALLVAAGVVLGGALLVTVSSALRRRRVRAAAPWWRRVARAARRDAHRALLTRRTWPVVAVTSLVAVACHATILLIAAHRAVPSAPAGQVLPLAMLVLAASAVPLHLLGWGPREGAAAWAFAAAGLGAGAGVETATIYGILALAACLPGVAVVVADWHRRDRRPAGARAVPRGTVGSPVRPAWHGGSHG